MLMIQGDGLRQLDYQRPAKAMSYGDASDEEDDSEMSAEEDSDIQDKETNDKQILAFLNE
ncbi:hypothetical protein DPMN_006942 [Dreissena polymorpha]|uniref:Uncharacterized protein n=1 Tax=Dreissena polymorpha TaxID=45954 RepID=A0A9D4MWD0_DREPO|nr:hypothetical protein DPMN_006942 [Dreissena polymorpha]